MRIDVMSEIPIYEQIIAGIEEYVLRDVYSAGDSVPSVRGLSYEISVNPNTIQKAYTVLTGEGILFSVPGKGLFISDGAKNLIIEKHRERDMKNLTSLVNKLCGYGVTKEEISVIINKAYGEERL